MITNANHSSTLHRSVGCAYCFRQPFLVESQSNGKTEGGKITCAARLVPVLLLWGVVDGSWLLVLGFFGSGLRSWRMVSHGASMPCSRMKLGACAVRLWTLSKTCHLS